MGFESKAKHDLRELLFVCFFLSLKKVVVEREERLAVINTTSKGCWRVSEVEKKKKRVLNVVHNNLNDTREI